MYQQVTLVGYLGQDPELKFTPAGKAITNFSVATNRSWTDAEGVKHDETVWWRVACWGKLAEVTNEYLAKGRPVLIVGRMNANEFGGPRIWTTNEGEPRASYEITAETVRFLGKAEAREEAQEEYQGPSSEDELPF